MPGLRSARHAAGPRRRRRQDRRRSRLQQLLRAASDAITRTRRPTSSPPRSSTASRATCSLRNLTRYGRNYLDRVVTPPRAATAANGRRRPWLQPAGAADPPHRYEVSVSRRQDGDQPDRLDGRLQHRRRSRTTPWPASSWRAIGSRATPPPITFANGRPPVTDLFNPDPEQSYSAGDRADRRDLGSARRDRRRLYAFDTVKLNDKWQVDLGAALGSHRRRLRRRSSATGVAAPFGRTDKAVSGRAGVVYKPVDARHASTAPTAPPSTRPTTAASA